MRPARYDLNQIPYEYTMEVMNRFKGLDLLNRVPEELWFIICIGGSKQNHPKEKEKHEDKVVVRGGFTNSWKKRREVNSKGESER